MSLPVGFCGFEPSALQSLITSHSQSSRSSVASSGGEGVGRDDEAARAALRLSLLAAPGGGCGCDQGLKPNSPFPSSRSPETFPGACPMWSNR